jgi:hypothetical protein
MFTNVPVGVDGRQGGRDAIALAGRLASPHATITLANVYGAGWPRAGRNTAGPGAGAESAAETSVGT